MKTIFNQRPLQAARRWQWAWSLVVAITIYRGSLPAIGADTNTNLLTVPSNPTEQIEQAKSLCAASFRSEKPKDRQARFNHFRKNLLPRLASINVAARGAKSDDQVLVRVARELAAQPQTIDELIAAYGPPPEVSGELVPQQRRPKNLQQIHLTEKYRPAWEALLLAPLSKEVDYMQRRFLITKALSAIANPESIPVLEASFASTCGQGIATGNGTPAIERQFRILEALNQFATPESLDAMFRCLALAEKTSPTPLPQYSGRTLREWVVRFLTDQDNYNTGAKWKQILEGRSRQNLTPVEQDVVNKVQAFKPDKK